MSKDIFLEIGTEEIPAGFLPKAMADLERMIRKELETARLEFGEIKTFATPRRLALAVSDVAEDQPTLRTEAMGPAKQIAYDADGNPTKAAIGFARGQGVDVAELKLVETEKGEYLFIEKEEPGRPTRELLATVLPRLVAALSFKKSMRWETQDIRFARPMHWIVALYGGDVISFTHGNLTSGYQSRGHRFMAPQEFTVTDMGDWLEGCRKHFVTADHIERKATIREQVVATGKAAGGNTVVDEKLLEEVTYLLEDSTPLCGTFEEKYLQLPRELLVTSMREHQRYFTIEDAQGKLLNKFITVSNTRPEDEQVVVKGNEKVIRARLADAMFFWEEDQKIKFESNLETLKNVIYQAKLGSSFEKVERFTQIAKGLAERFEPTAVALTERAARLAKCDLESKMVYEFPELQGIMGREYSRLEGEDPRVSIAIFEHYLPTEAGGTLPSDNLGAFVSIADKIDTICGCFGVGLIPTGSADPYALRRCAIGVLNIILDRGYQVSIPELIEQSLGLLEEKLTRPRAEVQADVVDFIRLRLANMLTSRDFASDVVDAVLAARFDEPGDAVARVEALAALKTAADFEPLAVAFKRVGNIIKGGVDNPVQADLFEADCERALAAAIESARQHIVDQVNKGDYGAALQTIAALREPVDAFFDGVMVMADDEKVKTNRLALLTQVAGLFADIADFTRIAA
ncbi:glycine--tRNA ligase subunit beta [Deltaproteobacteria bacterium IMCC39524]|nr:glycine--tRNA ligase subunit beta [Deltaproteobacteria bacterium IMCC39524]